MASPQIEKTNHSSSSNGSSEVLDVKQLLRVLTAVKKGDFSVRMPVESTGTAGKIADTLNEIIELNEKMATEFERISTVVGKEGKIAQRASISGANGGWTACVSSVNTLITDMVQPTAETARVIRAVARGDLSQTIPLEIEGRPLKGEFLQTAKVVNVLVDQLNSFASEVTRVAREVGTEGKLGGQAVVKGVAGTWKDLTDNVNSMASNLTGQVRAIAEVATAVTKGDLTRSITMDVQGEVAELKDNINQMIANLRATTQKNTEQDWLKTNLAKFSRMLQGQRDLVTVGQMILSELAPVVGAHQAEFYVVRAEDSRVKLGLAASYASQGRRSHGKELDLGEGLVGQCAIEKRKLLLSNVPSGA